ncbi:MAG: DUF3343 domain-containing protein [Clostridia bacterium]|nr:DUF3343 domain-containing protein [Clostridia bacterium]
MDCIIVHFSNRTDTMRLFDILKKLRLKVVIVPTPNQIAKSCGISLKAKYKEIGIIVKYINNLHLSSFKNIYVEKKIGGRVSYVKIA